MHWKQTAASWRKEDEGVCDRLREKWSKGAAQTRGKDLEQSILDYLARHNEKPRPFVWRKTADQIIGAVGRAAEKLI